MTENDLLLEALREPKDAIFAAVSRLLAERFSGKAVLETEDAYFDPYRVGEDWTFDVSEGPGQWSQGNASWWAKKNSAYTTPRLGWYRCGWDGKEYLLLRVQVEGSQCTTERWYVIAEDDALAEAFFSHVCLWHSTVRGEILVFQEGRWHGDEELFAAVQGSSLDDLTLHGNLKEQIQTDLSQFLEQEAMYERYRIPWKRGVLFLGPPGNGKTHLIRALTNYFGRPCLYVKSFQAQYMSAQQCVSNAFERAREVAPCFLILEDLDTLLTDGTRSFFLNEMDGFASNHGIVTIATCNFPERLDPAITERPSRFDRKYHFELPEEVDRRRYLANFQNRFDAELQLDEAGLDQVAGITHGYSYAYLKELCVSSAVRWVSTDRHRPIAEVMADQAETLLAQMTTEIHEPPPAPERGPRFPFGFPNFMDDDDE